MSDGPSKAAPEAEPLDDIILGDDDATQTDARPPLQLRPSQQPPKVAGSHPPPPNFRPSSPPARFPGGSTPPPQRFNTQPPQPDFLTSAPPVVRTDRPSARPVAHPSQSPASPSVAPGSREKRSSGRIRAANESGSQRPKRAKVTLRIPDDEVGRPASEGAIAATTPSRPPSTPDLGLASTPVVPTPPKHPILSPDDTLELPADELRARVAALGFDVTPKSAPPAPGVDPSQERGWTPFQPGVTEDDEESLAKTSELPLPQRDAMAPITPMRIVDVAGTWGTTPEPVAARVPLTEDDGADEPTERWQRAKPRADDGDPEVESSSPPSEEIPVDMDIDVPEPGEEATAAIVHRFSISDEIKIDEAPLATSDEVRYLSERPTTETGEVEVAPEDLVSVESLPPGSQINPLNPPPVKTAGKFPAFKDDAAAAPIISVPAAAPQPSVVPASKPQHPSKPQQLGGTAPLPPAPPVVASQSPAERPVNVAARTTAARRQPSTSPLAFASSPPVGGLAPPPMTDTAATRKKTRPWWEELFNDDFIRTMAKVSDQQIGKEVTFIEESLGCEPGAMVLDLACGTGRHAVELAARGYQVVGFDLSLAMLARASDEAQDRKQKINFVQGDMREMTFEETFDGVYAWNTSFGFFDETQNNTVIARLHKSLKKGGQLLLDVVNRDFIIRQAPSLAWFEGDGCICMDEMTIDFITSRMKVKRTLMMDDGRTKEIEYSVRIYSLHELGKMLHENGFRVAEVSGRTGTPGVFFGAESPRTLILAEKR